MDPELAANISAMTVDMEKMSLMDAMFIVLLQATTNVVMEHGLLIGILAIAGGIGIINSILRQTSPLFDLIFKLLIITPLIVIFSVHDRKYASTVSDELKSISGYVRTNPEATKQITRYVIGLVFVLIMAGIYAYWQVSLLDFIVEGT